MKVLVVDDDLITRITLEGILSAYAEVHCCVDGKEAVGEHKSALDRGEPYDLICMDLLMPVMGGLEALRRMRNEFPDVRVIMLTASENDADLLSALKAGAMGYLLKTCEPDDLFRALRSAMAGQTTVSGATPSGSGLATVQVTSSTGDSITDFANLTTTAS